jgi:hypothetical protein
MQTCIEAKLPPRGSWPLTFTRLETADSTNAMVRSTLNLLQLVIDISRQEA